MKLLFIIRCVKSNIADTPLRIFVMVICCDYLPQDLAVAICRRNLPQLLSWEFAAAICHGNLPQLFAVGIDVTICRGNLPQLFAVAICREKLP